LLWQVDGSTPLFLASQGGHVEVAEALIIAGIPVDAARVLVLVLFIEHNSELEGF
jgi:hypothetical protein